MTVKDLPSPVSSLKAADGRNSPSPHTSRRVETSGSQSTATSLPVTATNDTATSSQPLSDAAAPLTMDEMPHVSGMRCLRLVLIFGTKS